MVLVTAIGLGMSSCETNPVIITEYKDKLVEVNKRIDYIEFNTPFIYFYKKGYSYTCLGENIHVNNPAAAPRYIKDSIKGNSIYIWYESKEEYGVYHNYCKYKIITIDSIEYEISKIATAFDKNDIPIYSIIFAENKEFVVFYHKIKNLSLI